MATEVKPDRKLFPSPEKIDPWRLEVPTRTLFWDLRNTLDSIPEFVTAATLALFWKKSEVEFQLGDERYSVRYKKTPHKNSGYSTDFIRIMRFGKWLEDKKERRSVEDIVLISGKPTYEDTLLNPSVSYSSHDHEQHRESEKDSEAAIQRVKDFTDRLKESATVSQSTK